MDNGPWSVIKYPGRIYVGSDDFDHDVWLEVTGDFADETQREEYAQWLADKLNGVKRIEDPRAGSKREGVEL